MSDITIIGGITADIEGQPYEMLLHGDSNPGKISMSYGGVGRNIAENLARLGAQVSFFSVVGDDFPGRAALRELSDLGIDVSGVKVSAEENTAMYVSILDLLGDLELALCNMDALERISTGFIDRVAEASKDSKIIALDTNLTEETLAYAVDRFSDKPLFLDPVSVAKAERAKKIIGRFHTIKPNRSEAEVLSGIDIVDPAAVEKAGEWFLSAGVKRVFITLSAAGVYYCDEKGSRMLRPAPRKAAVTSATGAGDAFSAAVLYGIAQGFDREKLLVYGMAAASAALESRAAVNPEMSIAEIEKRIKENPAVEGSL
jgi:pseudouridine kinase